MNDELLKKIYWGKLEGSEREFEPGTPAYEALQRALKLEGDIMGRLEPGDPLHINDLVEAYLEYADSAKEQRFIEGIRMGGRLMLEILGRGVDEEFLRLSVE